MGLPRVGYDNLLEQGTVTSSTTDFANAYDWLTHDAWTPGHNGWMITDIGFSEAADYLAIAVHDLATEAATIKLQRWNGAAYDDIPGATITPTSNRTYMVFFTQVAATKYRLWVTTDGDPVSIACVAFGTYLEMERGAQVGYTPAPYARVDRILDNWTNGGQLGGRSLVRSASEGTLQMDMLTPAWVRASLDPFINLSRTQGWFLSWDYENYLDEPALCWTKTTPRPSYSSESLMSVGIDYKARTE